MDKSIIQYFHTPSEDFMNSSIYITSAGHRYCDCGYSVGPRVLDACRLIFVISGKGCLKKTDQELVTLSPGDMFVLFPRERHHYYADEVEPWELMWVSFDGTLCPNLLDNIGLTRNNYKLSNVLTHSMQRTLLTLINSLGDTADTNRLCATGHLYILFAYIKQITESNIKRFEKLKHDSCIQKVIRFIEQNYYLDIDVNMLCKHVNYSRSYLSRVFKSEMNMTIPEYTNMIRIQNAKNLLTETNMPMQEISSSVGVNDSFYFSKLFKKLTGQTPRNYRLTHQLTEYPTSHQNKEVVTHDVL